MRGEFYLLLATLLAAIGWIASKLVIIAVPGDVFIAARFLLASAILLPFCYKNLCSLPTKQLAAGAAVGLILTVAIQVWVYAVAITSSLAEGAFIMSLAMIIAPFVSWLFFKQQPNRAFWLSLPVAVTGMMLLSLADGWHIEESQWCFLLASLLMSVHFIFNKRVTTSIKPLTSIFLQLFTVGISSGIYVLFTATASFQLTPSVLFWFVVSTLVATAIRYLFQSVGQYSVKIESASLIMILEPIWTLILSITVLGEALAMQKLIGAGIIFVSLFVYIKCSKL